KMARSSARHWNINMTAWTVTAWTRRWDDEIYDLRFTPYDWTAGPETDAPIRGDAPECCRIDHIAGAGGNAFADGCDDTHGFGRDDCAWRLVDSRRQNQRRVRC